MQMKMSLWLNLVQCIKCKHLCYFNGCVWHSTICSELCQFLSVIVSVLLITLRSLSVSYCSLPPLPLQVSQASGLNE